MSVSSRLFSLYAGLARARGSSVVLTKVNSKGKRESKNQTVHKPYDEECWVRHLEGKEGLGVIPITDDATCNWGVVDIDTYPLDLHALDQRVQKLGIPAIVLRSKSGGAHLTVFFEQMEPCTAVRSKMAELSALLDLGDREIYPKQVKLANRADVGNWLNMPYYEGDNTERFAIRDGKELKLLEFLDLAESLRVDDVTQWELPILNEDVYDGPPCLQTMIAIKAGPGERNNVLFNLGVYARLKWESEWETKIEEFNREYMDPPLNHREVGSIIKSLEKKNYAFTCNNPPICNHCNREACKGREFGVTAFQHVDVGIVLDSVSKLNSEPPMWVLSLEGVRTEIETDELLDQNKFRRVCVNAINKIPGRMKAEDWDKFIRNKLTNIEIIDVPIETRSSDLVVDMVTEFFERTPTSTSLKDIRLGRWVQHSEGYYVRGTDYIAFLKRAGMEVDTRKAWLVLNAKGVTKAEVVGADVWNIPLAMYTRTTDKKYSQPKVQSSEKF